MDLLERYLHAVGQFLPAASRNDILTELRANLLAQMEARQEETGRPPTADEIAAILKLHGRPASVAARYLPQRSLIGPEIFPVYALVLRRSLPFVVLIYAIVRAIEIIVTPHTSPLASRIVQPIVEFVPVLLTFLAVQTIVFAAIEYYTQANPGAVGFGGLWEPAKLPPVISDTSRKPFFHRVADLVMTTLFTLYLLAVPSYPFLLLGPGAWYVDRMTLAWSPSWHIFYGLFVALLLAQLAAKALTLFGPRQSWHRPLNLAVKLFGVFVTIWLVAAHPRLLTSAGLDGRNLAGLNQAIDIACQFALLISLAEFFWNLWKYVRPTPRTRTLAVL